MLALLCISFSAADAMNPVTEANGLKILGRGSQTSTSGPGVVPQFVLNSVPNRQPPTEP